ncbi:MAG TPA: N-acetylmuramoyl-L-alanine amidase [Pseudomonas sp.]|uniref:N-acetylmuramoyl-L-alanine amidase n=1 Tax=Pseudomonas sp. TaxID=306 RepID=UPI002ED9AF43
MVHCSATNARRDVGVAEITQWHQQRGFTTVGYHYVIRRDGSVESGRAESQTGAHVKGYNARSIGVCLVGGVDAKGAPENNFTDGQFSALLDVLTKLSRSYPDARILGHRDLSPDLNNDGHISANEFIKACPCFDVGPWWIKAQARSQSTPADR